MESAAPGRQPDFMQGLLQVDDDLATVGKQQGDHAPGALVVNIRQSFIVDAVTTGFYGLEHLLGAIHEFCVSHYNFTMLSFPQILVRALTFTASTVVLHGCGQQGPLYLPDTGGVHRATLPETLLPSRQAPSGIQPDTPPLTTP